MAEFRLGATSDKLWNQIEFLDFLSKNQNGHIVLRMDPEAICLENLGLYKILDCFVFSQVDIYTENPLESHSKYNIIHIKGNRWLKQTPDIDSTLHCWNQEKVFFCLFGRPTAARLGIASHLLAKHQDKSLIHFSANIDDNNLDQFELDKLLHYHNASVKHAGMLIDRLPLLLSSSAGYTSYQGYFYDDPLTNFYKSILIDLVVESHVAGNTFYPTEKTTRAILLKKPFIAFASQNFLDHLHQLGFKTFCNYWSEDYDGYQGRDRYTRILYLLDSLSQKSTKELVDIYNDMQSVLNYNYDLLKNCGFNENNVKPIL